MDDAERVHQLDIRIARLEEKYTAKEKALDLIAESLKEYKSGANEWRGTVQDIIGKNPTRLEIQALFDRLTDKVSVLERAENKSEGKTSGVNASWALIAGVATFIIGVVALFITYASIHR